MTRITVDASMLAKLQGLGELIEICDESGNTVGHFYKYVEPDRDVDGRIFSHVSDAEMEIRRQETTGRPLAQILADLQKL